MNRTILITGGSGFIGNNICKRVKGKVIVIDNKYKSNSVGFVRADITDYHSIEKHLEGVEVVLHLAAIVGVPVSFKSPKLTWEVNTSGTLNLLEASRKNDVKRFVYASSNAIFGEYPVKKNGIAENYPKKPANLYGASKLAAEQLVNLYQQLYGIKTISLRYSNAYGPKQEEENVIQIFIKRALAKKPLILFGGGKQSRDFTYIDDIVEGTLLGMESNKCGVYNMSSGKTTTVAEIAGIIKDFIPSTEITFGPERAGDASQGALNINKAKKDLGYKPKMDIKDGIKKCIDWYTKSKS